MLKLVALSLFEKALWLWGISRDDGTKERNTSLFTQSLSMQELILILQINTYGETDPLSNTESAAVETEKYREARLAALRALLPQASSKSPVWHHPYIFSGQLAVPNVLLHLLAPLIGLALQRSYTSGFSVTLFYPRTCCSSQLRALFIRC